VGVGVLLIVQIVAPLEAIRPFWANRWMYWCVYVAPVLAWTAVFPIWIARRRGLFRPFHWPGTRRFVKEVLLAAILEFLLLIGLGAVVLLAQKIAGQRIEPPKLFENGTWVSFSEIIAFGIMATAIAPFLEEMFFRGFVYNALRRRVPIALAILLQACLFAVLHQFGAVHRLLVLPIGVALACVYEWRKTLLTPGLMHCFQNTLAVIIAISAIWNAPSLGIAGLPSEHGCRITSVDPESGADKAGLRVGDVITKFDGQEVHSIGDIAPLVRQRKNGDAVKLQILRDGKQLSLSAVIGKARGR
jgi:membrane protease YdiL (CAAX protease family)